MTYKFMYISNDDTQNYRLHLAVETHNLMNQLKFNKSPQGC